MGAATNLRHEKHGELVGQTNGLSGVNGGDVRHVLRARCTKLEGILLRVPLRGVDGGGWILRLDGGHELCERSRLDKVSIFVEKDLPNALSQLVAS